MAEPTSPVGLWLGLLGPDAVEALPLEGLGWLGVVLQHGRYEVADLPGDGLILSACGEQHDFVSRYFAPAAGIAEDAVTGSAHCVLGPFWAERLNRNPLRARQVSQRGGDLLCRVEGARVFLSGRAVPYLEGSITI